ncbi:DUF4426 domain-containing protein [Opacimonas viscosa]|uniref:DUF4426 domain-containing protein n=1 Tax=Opacimonas viscosa TaxID=2961944 RepID=A0AA41WXM3_9ALTE|nr:DUF4426 domain-containing protein [Opacimonas viscosa]MCP3427935.1 DUF4426 domain-containing protein [Opacimonas viscosa]
MRILLLIVSLLLVSATASAEQKKELGQWEVHYIVFPTTFLTPEIAKANGLIRSKYNALVNISVLDKTTKVAQRIDISGTARNLIGTTKPLNFKRVIDGEAIYYLAPLSFRHMENYTFSVDIRRGNTTENLTFKQEMFVD